MDRLIELGLESYELGLLSSDRFYNKPIIVFNSASFCGYTGQLSKFEELYQSGNAIPIALPTNEFGAQEPGDDFEISQFYKTKFNVSFPVCKKATMEHILFKTFGRPDWNFNKYLFDKDHNFVKQFKSSVRPNRVLEYLNG